MRELIISRIIEITTALDTVNAILKVLEKPMLKDFNDEYFASVLTAASDEDLLSAYDLLSIPPYEWPSMYGFSPEDCII